MLVSLVCTRWNSTWRVAIGRGLYDFQSIATLFLIGVVSVTPYIDEQEQIIVFYHIWHMCGNWGT